LELTREPERQVCPQRLALRREEVERLVERVHKTVELERAPQESDAGRNWRVARLPARGRLRKHEESDVAREHTNVVGVEVSRRVHVEPELHRELRGTGADHLSRRVTALVSGALLGLRLVRVRDLQGLGIELDGHGVATGQRVTEVGIELD